MPAKHDQVGVPFLRYAYNRFDNYVFENRGPHFKAGSSESLPPPDLVTLAPDVLLPP
jgi:hypothetical protein